MFKFPEVGRRCLLGGIHGDMVCLLGGVHGDMVCLLDSVHGVMLCLLYVVFMVICRCYCFQLLLFLKCQSMSDIRFSLSVKILLNIVHHCIRPFCYPGRFQMLFIR